MKIVKRVAVVFVLCLAVVGAYALLKKVPQLHVPAEDIGYLERVGISATQSASEEGLSGAHGSVIGAPPLVTIDQSFNQGSSTPPDSFGVSPTTNSDSGAPPFIATPLPVSVPSVLTDQTDAPPFITETPATPIASPFIPPPSIPPQPPLSEPLATPVPPPPLLTPSPPPLLTPPPPPLSTPPPSPEQSLSWDGSSTDVIFIPSAGLTDPWGVSGVTETKSEPLSAPPFSAAVPVSADSFQTAAVTPVISSDVPAVTETKKGIGTEAETKVTYVTVNDEKANTTESENRIRRLPFTAEITPNEPQTATQTELEQKSVLLAASVPVDSQNRIVEINPVRKANQPYQETPLISKTEKNTTTKSNDYHQTSIRQNTASNVTFAPTALSAREEQPMISFVRQKPSVREPSSITPVSQQTATQTIPQTTETSVPSALPPSVPTTLPSSTIPQTPEIPEIEVIPFTGNGQAAEPNDSVTDSRSETALLIRESVERFVKAQMLLVESGDSVKIRNAFVQLSRLYEHPELNDSEKAFMKPLLDRLALSVIYARNIHLLEQPYTIKLGDSIHSIAQSFEISPALLMKINGLTGARPLEPGTELKVVAGHFDAKISVKRLELTLILGGLYAGRFPVALGERVENLRGEFYVSSKIDTWNEKLLILNNGVTFYGIDDRLPPDGPQPTTVRFTKQDAKELFDILTERSVIIFED